MIKRFLAMALSLCLMFSCALAACGVCGGDGKCDECLGLGFMMARIYGSDELVQVGCPGKNCDGGVCTVCRDAPEQTAEPTPVPTPELAPEPTPIPKPVSDSDVYVFADPVVEAAVCKSLNKEQLTYGDLKEVDILNLVTKGPALLLSDLAFMPHLSSLDIRPSSSSDALPDVDLAPLASLTELRYLRITNGRQLLHPEALAGCTGMTGLYLYRCEEWEGEAPEVDLSALAGFAPLEDLEIPGYHAKQLQVLSSLAKLRKLRLSGSWLTDEAAAPLHDLTWVLYLTLEDTALTDPSWIAQYAQLRSLKLTSLNAFDVSWLASLPELYQLALYAPAISGIEAVKTLPKRPELLRAYQLSRCCDLSGLFGSMLKARPYAGVMETGFDDWYALLCAEEGLACRENGDEAAAQEWFSRGAKFGSVKSLSYEGEWAAEREKYAEAQLWYTLAAEQGSEEAAAAVLKMEEYETKRLEKAAEEKRKKEEERAAVQARFEQAQKEAQAQREAEAAWLASGTEYVFADPTVESAARAALKKEDGVRLITEELPGIKDLQLDVGSGGIVLDDLASMPSLTSVKIRGVDATPNVDLAPLKGCTAMEALTLIHVNEVKHFETVESFGKLVRLEMNDVQLTDAQAASLIHLGELLILNIENVPITDISWLSGCPKLAEAVITHTGVASADALRSLRALEFVLFDQNAAQPDLSFLLGRNITTEDSEGEFVNFDTWYSETYGQVPFATDRQTHGGTAYY